MPWPQDTWIQMLELLHRVAGVCMPPKHILSHTLKSPLLTYNTQHQVNAVHEANPRYCVGSRDRENAETRSVPPTITGLAAQCTNETWGKRCWTRSREAESYQTVGTQRPMRPGTSPTWIRHSKNTKHKANSSFLDFFSEYFHSVVGWLHRYRTQGYRGLREFTFLRNSNSNHILAQNYLWLISLNQWILSRKEECLNSQKYSQLTSSAGSALPSPSQTPESDGQLQASFVFVISLVSTTVAFPWLWRHISTEKVPRTRAVCSRPDCPLFSTDH